MTYIPQHVADELSKAATALGDAEYHLRKYYGSIPGESENDQEETGHLLDAVQDAWGKAQDAELICDRLKGSLHCPDCSYITMDPGKLAHHEMDAHGSGDFE